MLETAGVDLLVHMKTLLTPSPDPQRNPPTHTVDTDEAPIIPAVDEAVTGRLLVCLAMAPLVHPVTVLSVHLAMGLSDVVAEEDHSDPAATPSSVEEAAPLAADVDADADADPHSLQTNGRK